MEKNINIDRPHSVNAKNVKRNEESTNKKKSRTIVLKLTNYKDKNLILRNINKWKEENVNILNMLTLEVKIKILEI